MSAQLIVWSLDTIKNIDQSIANRDVRPRQPPRSQDCLDLSYDMIKSDLNSMYDEMEQSNDQEVHRKLFIDAHENASGKGDLNTSSNA